MTTAELKVRAYAKLTGWNVVTDRQLPFNPDPLFYAIQIERQRPLPTIYFADWHTALNYITDDEYRAQLEANAANDGY